MRRRKRYPKKSAIGVPTPMVLKDPIQRSDAMGLHPCQVQEGNERLANLRIDGEYDKQTGELVARRSQVKRVVDEENARRGDRPKIVNYDGGYGDPT